MAAACAPSSALALARILVALLGTGPDEDEGTRANAADGVLGEAGRQRAAAGRRLGLTLGSLEKRPHLPCACMSEECSAHSAIAAGVQNKDARGSKEAVMDWKTKLPATETEKTYPRWDVLGEKAKGVRRFFNLIKGKSMRQLS